MRVAFLGLGLMGNPMAANLARAGVDLTVWTRTPGKAKAFATEHNTTASKTPAEALAACDVAITMLVSGSAVEETLLANGAIQSLRPNAVLVDMSSVPPDLAHRLADAAASIDAYAIDAPVSGGTRGAADASLTIFAGGSEEAVERARAVLDHLGTVHHMGPPGAGQLTKLANQIIVAGTIGAVGEALAFSEKAGLDPAKVRAALTGGFADSRILQEHGQRMIDRNFAPGAPNTVFMKDIETILKAAEEAGSATPFTALAREYYAALIQEGAGNLDHSSLFLKLME